MIKKVIEKLVKKKALSFKNLDSMWTYYYNHGKSNSKIAEKVNEFNRRYADMNGGRQDIKYFDELKLYMYKEFVKC